MQIRTSIAVAFTAWAALAVTTNAAEQCDLIATEVIRIDAENGTGFTPRVIGVVERQQLIRGDEQIICKGLALLSDGGREEFRYTQYREFGEWWVQYEAPGAMGYSELMLLPEEQVERAADIERLPAEIAAMLDEADAFPAQFYGKGTEPLTIRLTLSDVGTLLKAERIDERGRGGPLSLFDDREGAVMRFFTSSLIDPIWQRAVTSSTTWTFTATPSRNGQPTISWPGGPTPIVDAMAPPAPSQRPTPQPQPEVAVVDTKPTGKTKASAQFCTFSITRIESTARGAIGKGTLRVGRNTVELVDAAWYTVGREAEASFADWTLELNADGSLTGSIPVYFLFPETGKVHDQPVTAPLAIPATGGMLTAGAEARFPLDHVFTGAFTIEDCAPEPRS